MEFDIAVTVDEEKTSDKGVGLSVYCLKAGAGGQTSASTSTVHRIKFSVGIDFESKDEKEQREAATREHYRNLVLCRGLIDGHCERKEPLALSGVEGEAIREASRGCQRQPWRSQGDCFGIKSLATTTSDCHGHFRGLAMTTPQITCDRLLEQQYL